MDVSLNPKNATNRELIERMQQLGRRILGAKRRFVALLPEIEHRQLYKELNYSSTSELARVEAGFSAGVVYKILKTAKSIAPFKAINRLFECSDIGWTKFAVIAPVLDKENAADFLHYLKKADKGTLEKLVKALKAQRKAEAERKRKELEDAERAANGQGPSEEEAPEEETPEEETPEEETPEKEEVPISGTNRKGAEKNGTKTTTVPYQGTFPFGGSSEEDDAADAADAADTDDAADTADAANATETTEEQNTDEKENTCHCDASSRKGVGKLYYLSGKAVVNVTLYADVAEKLLQRADKVKTKKSLVARLSKAVKDALFEDEKHAAGKGKRKPKLDLQVITFDKEKKEYKTRTRYGDVVLPQSEVKEAAANYNDPTDMNAMYERAKKCAKEYMDSRLALGKELTRYIPALVRKYVVLRSKGFFCEYPGCNCRGYQIHHLLRFALNNSCNPDNLVVLCKLHTDLAHIGALDGEDGPIENLSINIGLARKRAEENDARSFIDEKVKIFKDQASRDRHKAIWQKAKTKAGKRPKTQASANAKTQARSKVNQSAVAS